MIAGIGGDSGKTLVMLGLASIWRLKGITVIPFKKGPDYIDPAWLSRATGNPTHNLDTWMMGPEKTLRSFTSYSEKDAINLIEANRGLHDGLDATGSHSSAVLAKLLKVPVVLVLPVTKVTRTAAAIVRGITQLDPEVQFAGVIINRVGGSRHEKVVTAAVEDITGLPVLGSIRRISGEILPERHLGLVTPQEHQTAERAIEAAANAVKNSVDTDRLLEFARSAQPLRQPSTEPERVSIGGLGVKIGYFDGSAFSFYYPENLEALRMRGAELIPIDPLSCGMLPDVDALYVGGGFPETHAGILSENTQFHRSLADAARNKLPIWAECGGMMYLAKRLIWKDRSYSMAGVLPVAIRMHDHPQGHGYQEVKVDQPNPFLRTGCELRGHEFHYSQVEEPGDVKTIMRVERGVGLGNGRDGMLVHNVLASYLHLHATATPEWTEGMIMAAESYRRTKNR